MRLLVPMFLVCAAGCPGRAPTVDLADTAQCAGSLTRREVRYIAGSLSHGITTPEAWEACIGAMWEPQEAAVREAAVEALLGHLDHTLRAAAAPERQVHLDAYVSAWLARPRQATVNGGPDHRRVRGLRRAIELRELPQVNIPFAQVVVESVDIESARWHGEPVTPELIDGIEDEGALSRFVSRLPDADLVYASKLALVGRRADRSPFRVVREQRDVVVRAVVDDGHWTPPPETHPRLAVGGEIPPLEVLFATDHMGAVLRPRGADGPLELERTLRVDVEGLEEPITTCGEPDLDPTPCLPPSEVSVTAGPVRIEGGSLFLGRELDVKAAVSRALSAEPMDVGLAVGAVSRTWSLPVGLAQTPSRVYEGAHGEPGPDVEVVAAPLEAGHILLRVHSPADGVTWMTVLPPSDIGDFVVVSQGGTGAPGAEGERGDTGREGVRGSAADCASNTPAGNGDRGGQGSPGGPGGDGEDGGDGGSIQVVLVCPDARCAAEIRATLAPHLRSVGGRGGVGGPGGRGGIGGPGGEGGMGQTCGAGAMLPGREGIQGWDGPKGPDGRPGAEGRPGRVTWTNEAAAGP